MSYEKKCINCGAVFETKTADNMFCSQRCLFAYRQHKAVKRNLPLRECMVCGQLFRPSSEQSHICSWECKKELLRQQKRESKANSHDYLYPEYKMPDPYESRHLFFNSLHMNGYGVPHDPDFLLGF